MDDPFDLDRFIIAQGNCAFERALGEVARGRKTSHWMWFIFPQAAGLGRSDMSQRFAIASLEEARAYLDHAVLGQRYRACVTTLQDLVGANAESVFGPVDAAKLRSSLTLFSTVAPSERLFAAALERWFGSADDATIAILNSWQR